MNNQKQAKVDLTGLNHVVDLVEESFLKYSECPAFSCLGQTLTYNDIDKKSKALAMYFQQHAQLKSGDKIALVLPNLIQFPIAAYAALRAGLTIVNTNPLYTEREMRHQFVDAQVSAVVILADLLPKLAAVLSDTNIVNVVITQATDLLKPDNESIAFSSEHTQVTSIGFNQAIAYGEHGALLPIKRSQLDDIAVLQYTGGTTGLSKGAMLTHRNLLANVQQAANRFNPVTVEREEIIVCPLPLYHIYAFLINLLLAPAQGSLNILIPNPRDLEAFVAAIRPFPFSIFTGINTLFVSLCHHLAFKKLDFSKLKLTLSGGSALTENAANLWQEYTGCTVSEGYGLSETSPALCFNPPGQECLGTIGWPLIDTIIEIWDDNHQCVAQGKVGEIVAKGPQVMKGYWQQPQATAAAIINGFFKTGDLGCILADGRIKIVDRKKDMIIVSGFNVYPNEIENILSQHPDVVEAAVIGRVDDKTGERVCAYVVKEPNTSLSLDDLLNYCRNELTNYKLPKEVVFLDELPKSSVGKVLRRALKK